MNLELSHFAHRIAAGSLEFVLDLFGRMGCTVCYVNKDVRWALVRQGAMHIQFIETEDPPTRTETKKNSHIAFFSPTPGDDVGEIREWVSSRGKEFEQGAWSENEHWFDVPDVFTYFVVEIMQRPTEA